jgi:hypothetical protein
MLVAHIAISEVWWLDVAARGMPPGPEARPRARAPGHRHRRRRMPAKPGSRHPAALSGWPLDRYFELLNKTRACTMECLASWRDTELDDPLHVGTRDVTKGWILYHVLEHVAQHMGQIGLLAALQRPV